MTRRRTETLTAMVFEINLKERKGPYLELATANAFRLGDLFTNTSSLDPLIQILL